MSREVTSTRTARIPAANRLARAHGMQVGVGGGGGIDTGLEEALALGHGSLSLRWTGGTGSTARRPGWRRGRWLAGQSEILEAGRKLRHARGLERRIRW
jgi:hypothetical protein